MIYYSNWETNSWLQTVLYLFVRLVDGGVGSLADREYTVEPPCIFMWLKIRCPCCFSIWNSKLVQVKGPKEDQMGQGKWNPCGECEKNRKKSISLPHPHVSLLGVIFAYPIIPKAWALLSWTSIWIKTRLWFCSKCMIGTDYCLLKGLLKS